MSIESQMEAAWREQWNKPGEHSGKSYTDFTAGYLAALQSLYREIPIADLTHGVEYSVAFKSNTGVIWKERVMVSLSDHRRLCWIVNGAWEYRDRADAVMAVIHHAFPSPSDIFGRGE